MAADVQVDAVAELLEQDICWGLRPLPDPAPMLPTEQAVEATVDALAYRLLACEALDKLHTLASQLDRERELNGRLRDDLRDLRSSLAVRP